MRTRSHIKYFKAYVSKSKFTRKRANKSARMKIKRSLRKSI